MQMQHLEKERAKQEAQGETACGEGVMFTKLRDASEDWFANINGIAAVLATPLTLEFKMEVLDYVVLGVIASLTVVSIVVPFVIPGAIAATVVACGLRSLPGKPLLLLLTSEESLQLQDVCWFAMCADFYHVVLEIHGHWQAGHTSTAGCVMKECILHMATLEALCGVICIELSCQSL